MARSIVDSIRLHIEFVKCLANTMDADAPAFLSACETRKNDIIRLLRSQTISVGNSSKILQMLGARHFLEAQINEMQTVLVERTSDDDSDASSLGKRSRRQENMEEGWVQTWGAVGRGAVVRGG